MNYDNRNIVLHELIGLKIKVLKTLDKRQKGITGTIIDETKNTFLIDTGKGLKRLAKKISTFRIYAGRKSFVVEGIEINFRPYERIEKGLKFYKRRLNE